ncbi:hypothetical protein [Pseudomonas sp. D1-1]|uniref:hypothetical protein n=1 Tax=Pseudomonas sp. D1-1 TaxID=1040793 RepID=UPI003DA95E79
MPGINKNVALHVRSRSEGGGATSSIITKKLLATSNSSSDLVKTGLKTQSGLNSRSAASGVLDEKPAQLINKRTAKAVLAELLRQPRSESNYANRLACLSADRSIQTWQALTHDPETLKVLEQTTPTALPSRLAEPAVWLPEVEKIHTNVLMNLMSKLAGEYSVSFQSLALGREEAEIKEVSIVRGPPGAGKTFYLKGGFSLGGDEVKNYLQNRMPGLTMSQVHLQGSVLLDRFMSSMERKLEQSLTRDGLYLNPLIFEQKLQAVGLQDGRQKAAVRDIHVDLTTLCCRMLKRSTDEALLGFDYLSQSFRLSLENRARTIELVGEKHGNISDYLLLAWDGSKNIKVAECPAGLKNITVYDHSLFDQLVMRDPALIDAEIARVGETVIDGAFISRFTAGFEPTIAALFTEALSTYDGKTIAHALALNLDRGHVATSVASRIIARAVSA